MAPAANAWTPSRADRSSTRPSKTQSSCQIGWTRGRSEPQRREQVGEARQVDLGGLGDQLEPRGGAKRAFDARFDCLRHAGDPCAGDQLRDELVRGAGRRHIHAHRAVLEGMHPRGGRTRIHELDPATDDLEARSRDFDSVRGRGRRWNRLVVPGGLHARRVEAEAREGHDVVRLQHEARPRSIKPRGAELQAPGHALDLQRRSRKARSFDAVARDRRLTQGEVRRRARPRRISVVVRAHEFQRGRQGAIDALAAGDHAKSAQVARQA
jgi:hypothetical protein